jgi:hypothetical protein
MVAAVASALALPPVFAGTDAQKALVTKAIEKAPVSELAAKAAGMVLKAEKDQKAGLAEATIEVIVPKHPAIAASVVSAVSAVAPELSAALAAKAAELAPAQAMAIARAAAKAAPKQAPQIAAAVAKVVPKSAARVAQVAMIAVPAASADISEAVIAAVPQSQAAVRPLVRYNARADEAAGGGYTVTQTGKPYGEGGPGTSVAGLEKQGPDYARP